MNVFIKSHFIVGIGFFTIFLVTGVYMIYSFPELYNERQEVRMMYRATHIYILMSALINLISGSYLNETKHLNLLVLRKLASLLILVAPLLFLFAFFYEPPEYLIARPVSFWAVLSLVTGVILHISLNIKCLNRNSK